MTEEMNIYYDEEGDLLEISAGNISDCYFDNIGGGIFKIIDKKTNKIKGFVVHNFKKRTKNLDEIKLSLPFKFEISSI